MTDNRICSICGGGPGNECACSCGFQKWEGQAARPDGELVELLNDAIGAIQPGRLHSPLLRRLIDARNALSSERIAPQPERAQIVALQWQEPHPSHTFPNWYAGVPAISFVARIDTSKPSMFGKFPLSINGHMVDEKFATVEAAKAYAQRSFEDRARLALTSLTPSKDSE